MEREEKNINQTSFNIVTRPGHPDFLDLPWQYSLNKWEDYCSCLEEVERGISRHIVVFVNNNGLLYAIKELPSRVAELEYSVLRNMQELHLPTVTPIGYVNPSNRDSSLLITQYLEHSLPYLTLFTRPNLASYLEHLQDAMAGLLVQLHLAGVFWGDCSLSNVLFRQDAGMLQAYFVDAETSEIYDKLTPDLRLYDLEIMEENVSGGLADLEAAQKLPPGFSIFETAISIKQRYQRLWQEITRPQIIQPHERFRIQQRIEALNRIGFSISEINLEATEDGEHIRFKIMVTDRNYHSSQLFSLTGLTAEEMQARQIMGEIQELKALISSSQNQSVPISVAAYQWLHDIYQPIIDQLRSLVDEKTTLIERYCQVLEHKWYLSERVQQDVGHQAAVDDFLNQFTKS
jgi:hypothetical protein